MSVLDDARGCGGSRGCGDAFSGRLGVVVSQLEVVELVLMMKK